MAENEQAVFIVATSNDISSNCRRSWCERAVWTRVFFVDLPDPEVRREIFRIHLDKRDMAVDTFDLDALAGIRRDSRVPRSRKRLSPPATWPVPGMRQSAPRTCSPPSIAPIPCQSCGQSRYRAYEPGPKGERSKPDLQLKVQRTPSEGIRGNRVTGSLGRKNPPPSSFSSTSYS